MIPRDQLPEDAADWCKVAVSFPRLAVDSPASCPCSLEDVFEHVRRESADVDDAARDRLVFDRTAQVADSRFWLWVYTESDGEKVYVTLQLESDGSSCLGLAEPNGLTPDQFMLAEYYDEVYWS